MTGKWSLLVIPKAGLSFARMVNGAHSVVIIGKIWNVFFNMFVLARVQIHDTLNFLILYFYSGGTTRKVPRISVSS